MQHIYVNFKRFDVPSQMGGVNRISDISSYASTIIPKCEKEGTWFGIQRKMLGKKEGDVFFLAGDRYTILEISW